MHLSLCMIVRDEAETLGACLESVRGLVEEVCVLDTGSTDGTVELARSLGARVESFEWCDDFSAARNASLAMANGDWALVLDADERLASPDARGRLEAFVTEHKRAIGRVRLTNLSEGGAASCISLSRFFPLRAGVRFAGRVHEQLIAEGEPLERFDTGVEVSHLGYGEELLRSRDKLARNRGLVRAALSDQPTDPYLWYQLGRTEFVAGDFSQALDASRRAIELLDGQETAYVALLFETAAYALRELGRSAEAHGLLSEIAERFSRRPDTRFALALLDMDLGRLAEAEAGFRACLELDGGQPEGGESVRSSATWAPAFNLGVMAEVLQQREAATHWYHRALEFHPQHEPSQAALLRCR
jgi:tetratricopeptide (TPR) repeat protein